MSAFSNYKSRTKLSPSIMGFGCLESKETKKQIKQINNKINKEIIWKTKLSAFSNYKSRTKLSPSIMGFGCLESKETKKPIKQIIKSNEKINNKINKKIIWKTKLNKKIIWKTKLNQKIIECKKQLNDWNDAKNFK